MPTLTMDREAAAVGYLEERLNCPAIPPRAWFEEVPDWYDPKMGLVQVSMGGGDEGRVAALVAPWNECILDGKAGCWTAPASITNYRYAHVGAMPVDDGGTIRTANIGGKVNHADVRWPMNAAIDHYANTAVRSMQGCYVDTPDGIMFLGMMVHGSTRLDALTCMASALSGDWRWVESLKAYEMAGSQLVNNPAFRPLPATSAEFAMTASLGALGITASLDSLGVDEPPAAVFGTWTFAEPPTVDGLPRKGSGFVEAGRDIERLGAIIASLADRLDLPDVADDYDTEDNVLPESVLPAQITLYDADEDGDIDMDDVILIARSIYGCERCGGDGCRHCRHTGLRDWSPADHLGYDMADELDGHDVGETVSGHVYDVDAPVVPEIVPLIESGPR